MTFIGDTIGIARRRAGMTSKRLAERTGLSQQYVGDVQHGRRIPSPETLLRFSHAFPDADPGDWLWLVVRDLYGDAIFESLWSYAVAGGRKEQPCPRDDNSSAG